MKYRTRWMTMLSICGAFALTSGCETLRGLTADMARPSASIRDMSITSMNLEQATIDFDLEVTNPYSVALPLADVSYGLASGGTPFVSGRSDLEGSVPAGGSRVVRVPATVVFSSLVQVLRGVRPGATVPYTADLGISVDAPGIGPLTLPLKREGEIPVPAVPKVMVERVQWERLALDEARALVKLHVTNLNSFPVDLSELDYGLTLANRAIAQTSVQQRESFTPGGANIIDLPISFAPMDMGLAFLDILRGTGSAYEVSGTMKFSTPFGAMDLPFRQQGDTAFVR